MRWRIRGAAILGNDQHLSEETETGWVTESNHYWLKGGDWYECQSK